MYNGLKELGFECIKPEGAFYLFVKSPVADEKEFCCGCEEVQYPALFREVLLHARGMCVSHTVYPMRQL